MTIHWSQIWMNLFGTTTWYGIDIGFWAGMGVALGVTILMNVVFWSMKPAKRK